MSKPTTPEMRAIWASRQWYEVDLYTIKGGNLGSNVLRFCSGVIDVSANGFLYSAGGIVGPYFDRKDNKAKCHWKLGVEVDTLLLDVLPGEYQLFGAPLAQVAQSGFLDGAELTLEKAVMPVYGDTSAGNLFYFAGIIAEIDVGRSIMTMSINSHLELFNSYFPNNVVGPGCGLSLGDTGCGVLLDGGSVVSVGGITNTSPNFANPSITAGIVQGSNVSGTGIPGGTTVKSVSSAQIVLSANATATNPSASLTFTNPISFNTTGIVATGTTRSSILATLSGGPFQAGAFGLGKLKMTSGALSGLLQTVKTVAYGSPATIALTGYLPSAPAPGDTFTIYFGCDKSSGLPFATLANAASGSPTLTSAGSTQGILPGMIGSGLGIVPGTTVISVAGNSISLSANATANSTQQPYAFFSPNGCAKFGAAGMTGNSARYRGAPFVPQPALAT